MPVSRLLASATAVLLLAACGTDVPSPGPSTPITGPTASTATQPPSGTPVPGTAAPGTAAPATPPPTPPVSVLDPCSPADLKASHGLVEGAAGSRLTEIVLTSAVGCSVDASPALALRDAGGNALVGGSPTTGGRIDLVAGAAYTTVARLANWCISEPEFPLSLEIRLGADALPVTGGSFPENGDLPQCSGQGLVILEAGAWVATG